MVLVLPCIITIDVVVFHEKCQQTGEVSMRATDDKDR